MSDKNLATIQVVSGLQPIPNADAIEVASMNGLGWKCVVKKGEFKLGDKGVYIAIDTVVPEHPEFEFLRKVNFRVRTIRLRKTLSQGLLLPLSVLNGYVQTISDGYTGTLREVIDYPEGDDITELIGIKKYEKPVPANMAGLVRGDFPSSFVPRTDELMVQSILPVIEEIRGKEVYITIKCDGTSSTFANINSDIHVCSRNLSLKEDESNVYWQMYRKYGMDKIFAKRNHIAIQAEICGPGIQKNKLGFKEPTALVFDVFDVTTGKYFDNDNKMCFCEEYGLISVPYLKVCTFDFTLEQLLELAKGTYENGGLREGIVVRPVIEGYSPTIDAAYGRRGRMSFKVMNNDFLEKYEE